jgi:N-acetylneuraminate synthase
MVKFKIDHLTVGDSYPPIVIAEIGINHNGILDNAIEIVDSAIRAGAMIIKHQTHIAEEEMSIEAKKIKPGNSLKNIYRIIKENSLTEDEELKLFKYIRSKKKIVISTPFSKKAVDRLVKFKVPAFKIGSGEANNYHFVSYVCRFKKPIILSTGMNSVESINKSVQIIRKYKIPYALLHCTNLYPTPHHLVRLDCISELKKKYPDSVVGFSDHTVSINSCLASVALGAKIIEKHYIDSKNIRKGPDVACSMDSFDLKKLIIGSQEIYLSKINNAKKNALNEEKVTMRFAFASIASKKNIMIGEKLSENNIDLKRPGTGYFKVKDYKRLLGKTAIKIIKKNTQIKKNQVKL